MSWLSPLIHCSHKYQQLPLIPVEEFLAQHPEHQDDDENTLMVARIDHERAEREALEQQRQELLKRKQKLIADNKRRRDDLANLDNDLEKFIDVSILDLLYHNLCFVVLGSNILPGCQANPYAFREGTLKDGCTTGETPRLCFQFAFEPVNRLVSGR